MLDFCSKLFYNEKTMNKLELSIEIIKNKVKVSLAMLGINERYIAFEYLAIILTHLISTNSDSIKNFEEAILIVENKFNISKTSIIYGLKRLTDLCGNKDIISKAQFNLKHYCVLNRIKVLKEYALNHI